MVGTGVAVGLWVGVEVGVGVGVRVGVGVAVGTGVAVGVGVGVGTGVSVGMAAIPAATPASMVAEMSGVGGGTGVSVGTGVDVGVGWGISVGGVLAQAIPKDRKKTSDSVASWSLASKREPLAAKDEGSLLESTQFLIERARGMELTHPLMYAQKRNGKKPGDSSGGMLSQAKLHKQTRLLLGSAF